MTNNELSTQHDPHPSLSFALSAVLTADNYVPLPSILRAFIKNDQDRTAAGLRFLVQQATDDDEAIDKLRWTVSFSGVIKALKKSALVSLGPLREFLLDTLRHPSPHIRSAGIECLAEWATFSAPDFEGDSAWALRTLVTSEEL